LNELILGAGILLVGVSAVALRWPAWRLPALAFALLAMPGNVDNLLPQMTLDPNPIADRTAPVFSAIDGLVALAVMLSLREGRWLRLGRGARWIVSGGIALWALATLSVLGHLASGVEPAAVARGSITFLRVPVLLFLVFGLADQLRSGRNIGIAAGLGTLSLIANGLYTSGRLDSARFTAATFGRNGFSLALIVAMLLAAGLAVTYAQRSRWLPAALALTLASAALFGSIATGTRASLLAVLPAIAFALIVNRSWISRRGLLGLGGMLVLAIAVSTAAALTTSEGGRALSGITDPGETVDVLTDPNGQPWYSPVRTRTHFWSLAGQMIMEQPLTGVGPYQWNIQRYERDAQEVVVVVDTHMTYLQMAAEYGVPVFAGYMILLAACLGLVVGFAWRAGLPTSGGWAATTLAAAAVLFPVTELTNSHFFNVRLGPIEWLILASAVALSYLAHAERRSEVSAASVGALRSARESGQHGGVTAEG
jgi:O-antigen ligase